MKWAKQSDSVLSDGLHKVVTETKWPQIGANQSDPY